MATQQTAGWKLGDPIGYIRSEIPEFQTPPYDGDRYEAMVPDTVDLQERARLVIHAMTEATDPLADYEPYYLVHRRVEWDGRYCEVGPVAPGDTVTLTFPIGERTDVVHIEKDRYTLLRRGNDVVSIDPPGRIHPLYQRRHYRDGVTRWRTISRFVSNEIIPW